MHYRTLLLLLLCVVSLKATKIEDQLAKDAYLATVNASIVFTSQDGLSSGVYRFTHLDTDMRMYNLPLRFHFDRLSEDTNLFVMTDMGYSDTRHEGEVEDNTTLLHYYNRLQTYVVGLGGGLRYHLSEHSNLLFGGELLYSRIGISAREDSLIDDSTVVNFFRGDFSENYSYKLLAEYFYERNIRGHDIYAKFNYKLYKTLSEFKITELVEGIIDDLGSLQSQTSIASIMIGYETAPLYHYHEMHLTLEPYVKANYIWGDLAEVGAINGYGTAGMSLYWNTPEKAVYIYRYFIEPSISKGYGLEGVNLSLGFSLDF